MFHSRASLLTETAQTRLVNIYLSYFGLFAIKDLCNLLKRRPTRLNIEEIDKDQLECDPALQHDMQLVWGLNIINEHQSDSPCRSCTASSLAASARNPEG